MAGNSIQTQRHRTFTGAYLVLGWVLFLFSYSDSIFAVGSSKLGVYDQITTILKNEQGALAECQCLTGMTRDLFHLEGSLRGKADQRAVQFLSHFNNGSERPTLFFIGSGRLLNEATIVSSLMREHVSPRIVLIDQAYAYRIGKKIETTRDTSKQLQTALAKFDGLISTLSGSYRVKADIRIFYELSDAFAAMMKSDEKIAAFFLLDVFFPTDYSMTFLKEQIGKGLKTGARSDVGFDSLFFFLGKRDPGGEMKFPITDTDKKPPNLGRDPAVLDIYQAHIKGGVVESEKLISQDVQ